MSKLRVFARVGRMMAADEIFIGPDSIGVLAALPSSRILIVGSGSILSNAEFRQKIDKAVSRHITEQITPPSGEPFLKSLYPFMEKVSAFSPDYILAVGGGSVMDAAKILWIHYEHPDIGIETLSRPFAVPPLRGKCKYIAVPTTAGTGSEVSSSAVFQESKGERKNFIVSHDLLPDIAILDPEFLKGAPGGVLASSAFDALTHALEGYVSPYANTLSRQYSEQAARVILQTLPRVMEDSQDIGSLEELLCAASMAGVVQNIAIPGLAHAFSHELSSVGSSHGAMCGVMLPLAIEFNCADEKIRSSYNDLSATLGYSDWRGLVGKINEYLEEFGVIDQIPQNRVIEFIKKETFHENLLSDPTAQANPVTLDKAAIAKVADNLAGHLQRIAS